MTDDGLAQKKNRTPIRYSFGLFTDYSAHDTNLRFCIFLRVYKLQFSGLQILICGFVIGQFAFFLFSIYELARSQLASIFSIHVLFSYNK